MKEDSYDDVTKKYLKIINKEIPSFKIYEDEKTLERELTPLKNINDNYPKYLLRTDEFAGGNYQGIKTMHVADFLLSSEY